MPRKHAYEVLLRVERDQAYSHIALGAALADADLAPRDRTLVTELVYGTLTWQRSIDNVLEKYVRHGLRSLDVRVHVLLRMAVYQVLFLDRVPDYAIVDEAVQLTKSHALNRAAGMVNAVLRRIVGERDKIRFFDPGDRDRKPVRYLGDRYSLPNWLANRLLQMHGLARAEQIAAAFAERPAVYLRAIDSSAPFEDLEDIAQVDGVPNALRAARFNDAVRDGLEQGRWVVQDLGSQLVGLLTGAQPGQVVLDACAGLGGKTLHMAGRVGSNGHVHAVEPNEGKIEKLREALERTGLVGRVDVHQTTLQKFTGGDATYDVVLVDAPCTGLGVLRRHPETRWRRSEADITALARQQAELLDLAAERVKPGGTLVYSVCTFTTEEGPRQARRFLERHEDFSRAAPPPFDAPRAVDWVRFTNEAGELVVNPLDHDSDGFYAVRLKRR